MTRKSRDKRTTVGLGPLMAKGAVWVIGSRVAMRSLGLVSTIILARLLMPADFGLITLATLLTASIELMGSFNFEVWIIRHSNPGRAHYNTAWTLSVFRGLAIALILVLIAETVSRFFNEPRLEAVLFVLAVASLLSAFQNIAIADFQKELEFNKDFVIRAGSKLGAFLITVFLAFQLRNYWALVAGIVGGALCKLILSYLMHPYRPWFCLRHWQEAFHFTKWLMAGNLLGFFYMRVDTLILGKLMSSQLLGLYTVAHEMASLATSELVQPIRRVMFPGYSKMAENSQQLREAFLDGMGIIMLIGVPVAAGIGLVADPLVRLMLGDKWLAAIPLVRILALYGVASVGMANQSPLLIALGQTRLVAVLLGLGLLVLLPAFTWASLEFGVTGGAIAVSTVNLLLFLVSLMVTLRFLGIPVRNALARLWRVAVATCAMSLVVIVILLMAPGTTLPWSMTILLACVISGALVYTGTILLLWHIWGNDTGPERIVLDFTGRWWSGKSDNPNPGPTAFR